MFSRTVCKCLGWTDRYPTSLPTATPSLVPTNSKPTAMPIFAPPTAAPSLAPSAITKVEMVYNSNNGDETIKFFYTSDHTGVELEYKGVFDFHAYDGKHINGDPILEKDIGQQLDSITFLVPTDSITSLTIEFVDGSK